jgi:hypothetical protein
MTFAACPSAIAPIASAAASRASKSLELPSFAPLTFARDKASRVGAAIVARSFLANAANRCKMKGSISAPSSATMNRTRSSHEPRDKRNVAGESVKLGKQPQRVSGAVPQ